MRAILIDPTRKTITEADFAIVRDDVRSLYRILDVGNVERAGPLPNGDMVYVDGYGLEGGPWFVIDGIDQPLGGKGLILGETSAGYLRKPRTSLFQAFNTVGFPDIEFVGFEQLDSSDPLVIGSRAVFRPKD